MHTIAYRSNTPNDSAHTVLVVELHEFFLMLGQLVVFDWIRGRRRRKLIRGYILGIKGRGVIALENRLDCKSQVRIRQSTRRSC